MIKIILIGILFFSPLVFFPEIPYAANWVITTVDIGEFSAPYSSLALDSSGNPHISYDLLHGIMISSTPGVMIPGTLRQLTVVET